MGSSIQQPHGARAKAAACAWLSARILFWPVFLLHEIALLPWRFVVDEPPSEEETAAKASSAPKGVRSALESLLTPSGTVPLRRFQHSYQRSWLLLYESAVFYTAVGALEILGIDRLAAAFKPELTRLAHAGAGLLAAVAGPARSELVGSGPVSVINSTDPDFSLPYHATGFPFGSGGGGDLMSSGRSSSSSSSSSSDSDDSSAGGSGHGPAAAAAGAASAAEDAAGPEQKPVRGGLGGSSISLASAHLLCMCAKLVNEEAPRIRSVAQQWGLAFRGFHCAPAHASAAAGYVPDVVWAVLESRGALIVAFRGADPFTQISRRADVPTAKTARPGMGQVLDGFYRALFHERGVAARGGDPHCEYELLEARLRGAAAKGKRLYLTGHSIGGALAAVFAQALHARGSPLAARIGGLATFGQPRCGDREWAALLDARLASRCLRFTHACDMVPELPTAFAGYAHHGTHVHIAAEGLGRSGTARLASEAADAEALAATVAAEDRWAFALQLRALAGAVAKGDLPRAAARAFLLPLPGIADHFPADYERALRAALLE